MDMNQIHQLADVKSQAIGQGTRIWQYVVVLPGANIGSDCNICSHCFVENDVRVGNRVTIKNGVQLWDGITIEDDVFIGPNVTFTNDKFPRSRRYQDRPARTTISTGASIGAGATILPGITIGANSMIGAGAVVTRSVPPNAIVVGNPARITGYVNTQASETKQQGSVIGAGVGAFPASVRGVKFYQLPLITDIRGSLTVGEFERSIPFLPKRYFMVLNVPSVETRGEHAHRKCHQFLVCVKGTCSVVADDGKNRQEFLLDSPAKAIYLPPMVWGIQYKYSSDAVLLVFASDYYDAKDYVRDYSEFIRLVN